MILTRKERIYFDTSVIGGYHDVEFSEYSRRLFSYALQGKIIVLISEVVIEEIIKAPKKVQDVLLSIPESAVERISISPEIVSLRDAYLSEKILSSKWSDDALHVAAATVARADAIVSWNFSQIVRLDKMHSYNSVNLLNGYGMLTIVTPKEIYFDETEE